MGRRESGGRGERGGSGEVRGHQSHRYRKGPVPVVVVIAAECLCTLSDAKPGRPMGEREMVARRREGNRD